MTRVYNYKLRKSMNKSPSNREQTPTVRLSQSELFASIILSSKVCVCIMVTTLHYMEYGVYWAYDVYLV